MKSVPDHVPEHLVTDVDYYNLPDGHIDPQASWNAFRGKGCLTYSPYNGGHWVATEASDIFRIFGDFKRFSSRSVVIPDPGGKMLPLQADPPQHGEYRKTINPFFSPSAVEALAEDIRALSIELIEGFIHQGTCEFVTDFALQLPLRIFLGIVDLPQEDRIFLRGKIETFGRSPELSEKFAARDALHAYLNAWIDKRIAEPGEDAISKLIEGEVEGRPYTKQEVLATCELLLHGGLDTVASMLGFITLHLARTPEHRRYVIENPDKRKAIVQEFLRRFSVNNIGRVVVEDMEYNGVTLKEGDKILLSPSLFNLDPKNTDHPTEIDFSRDSRHITFGSGRHTCAGALLARCEIEIFLEEWLARIPQFSVDPHKAPKMHSGPSNSVSELHLQWPIHDAGHSRTTE